MACATLAMPSSMRSWHSVLSGWVRAAWAHLWKLCLPLPWPRSVWANAVAGGGAREGFSHPSSTVHWRRQRSLPRGSLCHRRLSACTHAERSPRPCTSPRVSVRNGATLTRPLESVSSAKTCRALAAWVPPASPTAPAALTCVLCL